jgi:hypothetical protein
LIARWVARIWSLGPILFALGNALFGGLSDVQPGARVYWYDYLMLSVLALLVGGLALAWWLPLAGGLIAVAGALVVAAIFPVFYREQVPGLIIVSLLGPGLLFIASVEPPEAASG